MAGDRVKAGKNRNVARAVTSGKIPVGGSGMGRKEKFLLGAPDFRPWGVYMNKHKNF
jgi:hypothetical protein